MRRTLNCNSRTSLPPPAGPFENILLKPKLAIIKTLKRSLHQPFHGNVPLISW